MKKRGTRGRKEDEAKIRVRIENTSHLLIRAQICGVIFIVFHAHDQLTRCMRFILLKHFNPAAN